MKKFILTAFALCLTLTLVFGWMPTPANAAASCPSDLKAPALQTAAAISDETNRSAASVPPAALRFAAAYLKLEADLTVTFMVKGELFAKGAYENPRVVYSIQDVWSNTVNTQEVTEYTVNSQGRMLFPFTGISPRMMKAPITATLYGTYQGVEYSYSMEYKLSDYCYSHLNNPANHGNTKFMTLLADLLNYGTAHQKYIGHDTDNLINAEMTDFHKSFASTGKPVYNSVFGQTGTNYSAAFTGATLSLNNAIVVRYTIRCDDLTDVNLKVEIDGEIYRITADEFVPVSGYTNRYYVSFRKLQAKQLRESIKTTICRGDSVISKTATYSVESYAASVNDSSVLGNLVKHMMYYGDSAAAYFNS